MSVRLAALIVSVCLWPLLAFAQAPPSLTRQQRELLQALVTAVDAAAAQPDSTDATWQSHVMRAADGSHYVAFTIAPPPRAPLPNGPALLYVRLDAIRQASTPARSQLRDWLAGGQTAPPPIARSGIALGDMPVMGTTGNIERGSSTGQQPTSPGMVDLQLMDLERRRARERQQEAERRRRAELEGAATRADEVAFEDFDLASRSVNPRGERIITRALTAGPGDYFLFAAWADPAAATPAATIRVIKQTLRLPNAPADELLISSVIVSDAVRVLSAPPSGSQASHPYTIGQTEIVPAADASMTSDERLNIAFQIINPRPSLAGKPDLEVAFRIVRIDAGSELPVASLTTQQYSEATLPPEFDLRAGHPLLAALSAPLETLTHGTYRIKILVIDRIAGESRMADTDFTIAATAASLLKLAPAPSGAPFQRESVLRGEPLRYVVDALRPAAPSAALQRALQLAANGSFVELMRAEAVAANEEGVRAALTGLARLGVGDDSAAVQFQRAQLLGAPSGPTRFLSGAARAAQDRDMDAIAAWQEAIKAGAPSPLVAPYLLEALVRRGDAKRASALIAETRQPPVTAEWMRAVAATHILAGNDRDAIAALDPLLQRQPDDAEAQWLLLRALFSQIVKGDNANRERFMAVARRYIEQQGGHAALVAEWVKVISS